MKMRYMATLLAVFLVAPAPAQQAGGALGAIDRSVGGIDRGVRAEIGQSGSAGLGKARTGTASNAAWGMAGGGSKIGTPAARLSTWGQPGRAREASGPGQQPAMGERAKRAAFTQQGGVKPAHAPAGIGGGSSGSGSKTMFAFTGKASAASSRSPQSRKKADENFANKARAHGNFVSIRRAHHFKQKLH